MFVICSLQDTFSAARSMSVLAPSIFLCSVDVNVHVSAPYTSTDSTVALKKFLFKFFESLDFHIVVNWFNQTKLFQF